MHGSGTEHAERAPSSIHCATAAISAAVRYGGPSAGMRTPIGGVGMEIFMYSRLPAELHAATSLPVAPPASTPVSESRRRP